MLVGGFTSVRVTYKGRVGEFGVLSTRLVANDLMDLVLDTVG